MTSPAPRPDFDTPLAPDEAWAHFDAHGNLSHGTPCITFSPAEARAWAMQVVVRRVRLVSSPEGATAREPMTDVQFHDFVAGALHGLASDGTPVKDATERDEAQFRDALDCAGLSLVSTTVPLFATPPAARGDEEREALAKPEVLLDAMRAVVIAADRGDIGKEAVDKLEAALGLTSASTWEIARAALHAYDHASPSSSGPGSGR